MNDNRLAIEMEKKRAQLSEGLIQVSAVWPEFKNTRQKMQAASNAWRASFKAGQPDPNLKRRFRCADRQYRRLLAKAEIEMPGLKQLRGEYGRLKKEAMRLKKQRRLKDAQTPHQDLP